MADERILGRQVQDVIFHDPRRHEENRLRMNARRARRVLDELDELVAVDDLARRHREVSSDLEGVGADGLASRDRTLPILDEILRAPQEVLTALGQGLTEDLRVRE